MEVERVRRQLDRILASAVFAKARRPSKFLRFLVERALEGRHDEIKESVIGIEVLGRKYSFDAKSDPIVRVEAGRLRERLRSYYQGEGVADSVVIAIPKGGYVPEFSERQLQTPSTSVQLVRLSILPPRHAAFESFAISPDGRHVVFTAALDGKLVLWVRALDVLEPKPLIGTDNATYPFWSPDSRSIAFFTPNKLKTIEIGVGPARDIADVVVGRGGAWSPEGVIVFCPRPMGILYQIAARGSRPAPVTSLDTSRAEVAHGFPQFLPNGRDFVYLAASSRPGESSIRTGSLDSAASKVLVEADTSATWAPVLPGHRSSLLFVSHGDLIAQPFNAAGLEIEGERAVVVPQVGFRRWHQTSVSASSSGILLYQNGPAEDQQLSWIDRRGKSLGVLGPRNDYLSFALSPDERYVACCRDDDPATVYSKIWVMDLNRDGAVRRLTDPGATGAEFTPIWSPDGRDIVFSRGDDRGMRLMRQPLHAGSAICVLETEGPKFPIDWSGDGRFVTYASQVPDYRYLHTWVLPLDVSQEQDQSRPLLHHAFSEMSAYFSPSDEQGERWIAYSSDETGRPEVYVQDFPAGRYKWQVSNEGGLMPHWRADGRELFFLAPNGSLMAVAVNPSDDARFDTPHALFATGLQLIPWHKTWMNQYAVARDGERFLLNRPVREAPRAITVVIPH